MNSSTLPLKIAGIGRYLPSQIVSSEALEKKYQIPVGWCEEKQGIKERRWSDGETASGMAAEASREALRDAGIALEEIDLIISASGTAEQAVPDGGALLQRELGLGRSGLPAFSVNASCLSFLFALDVAAHYLSAQRYRKILIASSDVPSCGLNYDRPENFTLFGDGAAAIVVTQPGLGEASCVHAVHTATYGCGADFSAVRGLGTRRHPNDRRTKPEDNLLHIDGAELLKIGFEYLPKFYEKLWSKTTLKADDCRFIIPHQPSRVVLDYLELLYPEEKIVRIIDRFGNCVGASLPLALYEAIKVRGLERGQHSLLTGTGSGVSFAGVVLTY